jgi:hypothetical protein
VTQYHHHIEIASQRETRYLNTPVNITKETKYNLSPLTTLEKDRFLYVLGNNLSTRDVIETFRIEISGWKTSRESIKTNSKDNAR